MRRRHAPAASRFALVTIALLVPVGPAAAAPPEAPSGYLEAIETPDETGGTMGEMDAAPALGDEARQGERTQGIRAGERGRVEEIVVQARKREEMLEDTPVAVTALSAHTLKEAGVYRVDQLSELVPNLQFNGSIMGNVAQFTIRGVGTGNFDLQFDPGVAMYLDGVFLPRAFGSLLDVIDVAQIEVLRGPQGTLFGKNSVGGAINVTTVKPQPELAGYVMVRPGNLNSVQTQVMWNVPIVEDRVLSRFAFSSLERDGYVFDTFRNELYSDQHNLAFLGSLRFLPAADVTFDLTGMWTRASSRGRAGQCRVANPNAALVPVYPADEYFDLCEQTTPFSMTANTAGLSDVKSYGTWGVLNWGVGDAIGLEDLAVKAQGSWNEQIPRFRFDVDNTSLTVVDQSTAGGGVLDGDPGFQQQVAGELQVNGTAFDGRVVFVSGFFYQQEEGTEARTTVVGPNLNTVTTNQTDIDNWTAAPFVQVTGDVTDWLSLTAGYRYTWDNKKLTVNQYDPTTGNVFLQDAVGEELFTKGTPMASLAATLPADLLPDFADHLMGYFTYSQGFKGGGFNALAGPRNQDGTGSLGKPFQPETLDNFEIGFKTILLDDRVTLNTAFFYGKYDDIQKVSVITGTGPDGNPVTQRITENAAKATTKGFEIEALALPMQGMQISGSVGVTDATYDDFPNAVSDFDNREIDRSGQTFNNVPEFQSFLSVQYSFALVDAGPEMLQGWLTPRLEWYYQSKVHLNGPELPQSDQAGYNLLNARLSYDFWDDRAQVALWARNLTDETYFKWSTPIASTFGTVLNFPELPRTYGAELSYRFD